MTTLRPLATALGTALGGSASNWLASLAELNGETRLYDLEVLGATGPLAVEAFASREALSELYELNILALSTDATLNLNALLWQPARLWITHSDGRREGRSGLVQSVEALECDGGLARYALKVVPWLWLATQQSHSRVYQHSRVTNIIESLLGRYPAQAHWRFEAGTRAFIDALPPRERCTQYNESDHAFLQRLLREEGLGYHFEEPEEDLASHRGSQCLVIFSDSTAFAEDHCSQHHLGGEGIRLHRHSSQQEQEQEQEQEQDSVQRLEAMQQLAASQLTTAAWSPEARRVLAASLTVRGTRDDRHSAVPPLERYLWAGHGSRSTPAELERAVYLAQQAVEAQHCQLRGQGTVRSFRPGRQFLLQSAQGLLSVLPSLRAVAQGGEETLRTSGKQVFALTAVQAVGINNLPVEFTQSLQTRLSSTLAALQQASVASANEQADQRWSVLAQAAATQGFSSSFECQSAATPWRAVGAGERRGRSVQGAQTAQVIGLGDAHQELYRDMQGRIQLRFHWQRGEDVQDASSGWVRVAQQQAGNGMGYSWVPRIGQEVLVGFVDDDIDQPLVLGALYNGRGEGGEPVSPGGEMYTPAGPRSLFAQASDEHTSAQGNPQGGHAPAWHGHSADVAGHRNAAGLLGFKSREHGGLGHNQLQLDDHDAELRSQLASSQAQSALTLGHLIHTADNARGSRRGAGFELRTDDSLAVRSGAGVLLSTWHESLAPDQRQAVGEITGPLALLQQAQTLSTALDAANERHQANGLCSLRGNTQSEASGQSEQLAAMPAIAKAAGATVSADDDAQALEDAAQCLAGAQAEGLPHLGQAMVITAGRAGLGVVAGQSMAATCGENLLQATGGDLNTASGRQVTLHAGQSIAILATAAQTGEGNCGLNATAAQGALYLAAQKGSLNADSAQSLRIVSAQATAEFAAAKAIKLVTAGGASIEIAAGNITVQCPGKLTAQAAKHQFTGATQLSREMNTWPETQFDERFQLMLPNGDPAPNYRYAIHREDGSVIHGATDAQGWTTLQKALGPERLQLELLGSAEGEDA